MPQSPLSRPCSTFAPSCPRFTAYATAAAICKEPPSGSRASPPPALCTMLSHRPIVALCRAVVACRSHRGRSSFTDLRRAGREPPWPHGLTSLPPLFYARAGVHPRPARSRLAAFHAPQLILRIHTAA
ncbi:uncharacterized protein LOC125523256 [Triticum urartu]|uniref:uncharacterized protein LOC125523256 n=1 Tax=Triticum urartu TaxID=4572 RepID=UPI002043237F|nr:uncharacterized protein LOC125523256 [Triticum urartu]